MAERGFNQVCIIGHLTNDATYHAPRPNWNYLLFTVAVNAKPPLRKKEETRPCWIQCQFPFADRFREWLLTGRKVHIWGHLESEQSEDRRKNLLTLSVDELILLDSKPRDQGEAEERENNAEMERAQAYAMEAQSKIAKLKEDNEQLARDLRVAVAEVEGLHVAIEKSHAKHSKAEYDKAVKAGIIAKKPPATKKRGAK